MKKEKRFLLVILLLSFISLVFFTNVTIIRGDDGYEPNDTFYDAYPISLNIYYSTLQITQYNEDWFEVYVDSNSHLYVEIDWSSSSYDIDLYLYDTNQNQLVSSTGVSNTEVVDYCTTYSGYYYIKISLFSSGTDIPYSLHAYTSGPCLGRFPIIPFGNYFLLFAGIAIIGLISLILIRRKKLIKV